MSASSIGVNSVGKIQYETANHQTEKAFKSFSFFLTGLSPDSSLNEIREAYSLLHDLIPQLDEKQISDFIRNSFDIFSHFPTLKDEQRQLALDLGNWYFDKQPDQALHYYAKAHLMECPEGYQLTSRALFRCFLNENTISHSLEMAARKLDSEQFNRLLSQIEHLKHFCYLPEDYETLHEKVRDIFLIKNAQKQVSVSAEV